MLNVPAPTLFFERAEALVVVQLFSRASHVVGAKTNITVRINEVRPNPTFLLGGRITEVGRGSVPGLGFTVVSVAFFQGLVASQDCGNEPPHIIITFPMLLLIKFESREVSKLLA